MLNICSATSHSQLGLTSISSYWKAADVRCNIIREVPDSMHDLNFPGVALTKHAAAYSNLERYGKLSGVLDIPCLSIQKSFDNNQFKGLLVTNYSEGRIKLSNVMGDGNILFVDRSNISSDGSISMDFTSRLIEDSDVSSKSVSPDVTMIVDIVENNPYQPSDILNSEVATVSAFKTENGGAVNEISNSINDLVSRGVNIYNSSVDAVSSSISSAREEANAAVDDVISGLTSNFDTTEDLAKQKIFSLSGNLKEASGKLGISAVNLFRGTIILVEDSLAKGFSYIVYSYGSAKEYLPPDIRDALNVSESKLAEVLSPIELVFNQAYNALQELEVRLGLDPNDPIIPLLLFLGISATLWGSYWISNYAGYAGELTPQSTSELLKGQENAALIDVRPEDLRERDGIPDLRRAARFRYASVAVPEVDLTVRKLLKGGRNLDDMLVAAVIRDLNIVQGRQKIIVMDADGSQSKGIARSLRKLGIKNPYLLQGGFQSWIKAGLRTKELKPETTLQILSEEAEAILEDINPTPLKLLVYGMGLIAASYAVIEWEMTLQLAGIIGIGLTVYRRLASYEDAEDFKQDVRLLLAPVRLGGQAISWAATKLEPNRNGLPTSPSSSDVQNRVLQAVAKHESQPPESEEANEPATEFNT